MLLEKEKEILKNSIAKIIAKRSEDYKISKALCGQDESTLKSVLINGFNFKDKEREELTKASIDVEFLAVLVADELISELDLTDLIDRVKTILESSEV